MSSFNETVHQELQQFQRDGVVDDETARSLKSQYPTENWNWLALGRWFLIFGIVNVLAGAGILLYQHFEWTLQTISVLESVGVLVSLGSGYWLVERGWTWTGRILELFGGLVIVALTFTVAAILTTEPGNPQPLFLLNLSIVLPLSYVLVNPLLLIESLVLFFFWIGGEAGYVSSFYAYFLGVSFPLRFLISSGGILIVGVLHQLADYAWLQPYRGFYKIWLSMGLLYGEIAFWLLSIFGLYGTLETVHYPSAAELWLFNLLWFGLNVSLVVVGSDRNFGMLTGYGVTFASIQIYTKYFEHVVGAIGDPFGIILSLILLGVATLAAGFLLEKQLGVIQTIKTEPSANEEVKTNG